MAFVKFPIKTTVPINSLEELQARSKQDDPEALYWYGECLWRGEHMPKHNLTASHCFMISALLGNPKAYYRLGELYRYGQSVQKNNKLACTLFQAAYAMGIERAVTAYALVLIEEIKTDDAILEGKILLKYAKDNGDDDAEYYIEEYYPDVDELEANLIITDEMKAQWIEEGLAGLLEDIEHRAERHCLICGSMYAEGTDTPLFDKVDSLLEDSEEQYKKQVKEETEKTTKEQPDVKIEYKGAKNRIGEYVGTSFSMANTAGSLYGMRKFNALQGHGYAAERANHLADLLSGKRSQIIGNNNKKFGADRLVDGVYIQSKYCQTGKACIDAAFKNGEYIYKVDGKPMPIEVPYDKYTEAVSAMEERIAKGQVPGVDDISEAKNLVRRGFLTYDQAVRVAQAGTIESITYDAVNGAIVSTTAFGISATVTFAIAIWNGEDWKCAVKMAVESGLKVAGTAFVSTILSSQLTRVVNASVAGKVIEDGAKAVYKLLTPKARTFYLEAHNCGIMNIYDESMSRAAELFKNDLITGSVSIALISIPSVIELFRGRISKKQLFKNVAVSTGSVVGGGIGRGVGSVIGARLIPFCPKLGSLLGGLAGAAIGSYLGQTISKTVLDEFIEDDAKEMLSILEYVFTEMISEFMVSEKEAKEIMKEVSAMVDEEFLKDMYASGYPEGFAYEAMFEYFEETVCSRKYIIMPESGQMLSAANDILDSLADKYQKTA